MRFRSVINFFESGNVIVCGLRGKGKDMLMSNVVVRRKLPYVSNIDYGGEYHRYNYKFIDCGKNDYRDFLEDRVKYYEYPFPDDTDVYLSDCGIYFPSQYCGELNRDYKYLPTFMALSRQLGCNFHANVQSILRCWDKIREQGETFILCLGCKVIFGIVFQRIRIYDNIDSCAKKVRPFSVRVPLICTRQTKVMVQMQRDNYLAAHGSIRSGILIYKNKSNYDTRYFQKLLKGGKKDA